MTETAQSPTPLPHDYSLEDVATALGMSTRWVRDRIKDGEAGKGPVVEHTRRGHKIKFTAEQAEKLRVAHTVAAPVVESITTGPAKRRRSK